MHAAEAGREGAAEEWAGERDRLTQAAADERHRLDQRGDELEQALREAQTRQETQAEEWAAERDELKAAVHAAEAGREGSAEEWAGERDRLTQAAEAADDERHRLNQRGDEFEKALRQAQTRQETQAEEWAAERDELKTALHVAEDRWGQLAEEWSAEREQMTEALQDAQMPQVTRRSHPRGQNSVAPDDHVRMARRFKVRPVVRVQIDGFPATLVDLSSKGAQVLVPTTLRLNQRVKVTLAGEVEQMRFQASVGWVSPDRVGKTGRRWHRAGLAFIDADPDLVEAVAGPGVGV